ncbi:radical SAM/SPASM domain-containing protein [Selenomonas sp. ND2010]|uniref:radical SAM/SPASM domain-containing protein n=1 Tax=Selenomonas sp. ND2010 TaxID=1410618 RepID=UPI00051C8356|nr:SPASM domain-containing protein [Selenomonas sp. ND2010]
MRESYSQKKAVLDNIKSEYISAVNNYMKQDYSIVVYGAGMYGMKICQMLRNNNIPIAAIGVTNIKYNRDKMFGIRVHTIDELVNRRQKYVYLLAIKPSAQKILEDEMNSRGVNSYIKLPKYAEELFDETFFRPVIEITPRIGCSVNCHFCPQELFLRTYNKLNRDCKKEMSIDDFKYYVDKTPEDCIIDFSGFVEPFLAHDGVEMIKYAYEKGRDIRLFTTLVGLTLEGFKQIEDIPFKFVVLHIPDVKKYANIPLTKEYFEILQYVILKKKKDGMPFVDMANCQAEPNPDVVKLIENRFPISWQLIDRAGNLEGDELQSVVANENNIYCTRALNMNHNVLLPNGDLLLCCMDFGMKRVLGNLKSQDYEEVLRGITMGKVIEENKNEGDLLCRKCVYAQSFDI